MSFNENVIEEIKTKCNIIDVIGSVVSLKKAGSNYKGLCPFHNEKTPSFVVSETKQFFNCFGCGAKGDVITFVQKYYNLDFVEAVEKLAKEYNIEIKQENSYSNGYKEELYEINRLAARFFFSNMAKEGSPGYIYMYNRGISASTIKKFGIGYAPDSWDALLNHMKEKNIDLDKLVSLGLLSKSKDRYFDKFRNRVIFPIINTRGKVIGFGGRIIGEGNPKYLNSPESSIFLKKNNLYGLNLSKQDIAKEDCAVLVEGYMDVVSLYQSGVKNVSASLGTALTENQAKLLKRYTKKIILSYDSDSAGRKAALRGIDILHDQELKAKVLHVSDGKDPDEFIKKHGRNAFLKLIDEAPGFADYKLDSAVEKYNLEKNDDRIDFIKDAAQILKSLSPAEQDIYIKKTAKISGISEGAIRLELSGSKNVNSRPVPERKDDLKIEISDIEKTLIKVIVTDINLLDEAEKISDIFSSTQGKEIFQGLKNIKNESDEFSLNMLMDILEPDTCACLADILENVAVGGMDKQIFKEIKDKYQIGILQKQYDEITKIIEIADESIDEGKIRELIQEQMKLLKSIQEIKEGGKLCQ